MVLLERDALGLGGAWARWRGGVRCARAPGLISVRGLAVRRAGDVMGDGVFPRDAVRPLGLWRPSTRWWRQRHAGSGPRCIGVTEGRARTRAVRRAPGPRRRARAGCGS